MKIWNSVYRYLILSFLYFIEINGCKFGDSPEIVNGRLIVVRPYRGSVLRYKCHQGFKLFGQHMLHCQGNKWSSSQTPVCASKYLLFINLFGCCRELFPYLLEFWEHLPIKFVWPIVVYFEQQVVAALVEIIFLCFNIFSDQSKEKRQ